jgi:sigma-B regulation protein RsbU (phosphoserine phosphatase)
LTWLRPTGAAIGLVEEGQYGDETIRLHDGDLLVMYTDGVTEAVNPLDEQYGEKRLTAAIRRARQSTPQDVVREIREDLEIFSEGKPWADDTTLVVCRIT